MLTRSQTPIHGVGKFRRDPGSIQESQSAKRHEDHQGRDGIEPEPLSEGRRSESDREQHEENCHHRHSDVHGIGKGEWFPT